MTYVVVSDSILNLKYSNFNKYDKWHVKPVLSQYK